VCVGVAVALDELPLGFVERHGLTDRIHERPGLAHRAGVSGPAAPAVRELRFLYRHVSRLLPVRHEGQLLLARWGTTRVEGRGTDLPVPGWTWKETIESGWWAHAGAEAVTIPAAWGLDGGFWFPTPGKGIQGLLLSDPPGRRADDGPNDPSAAAGPARIARNCLGVSVLRAQRTSVFARRSLPRPCHPHGVSCARPAALRRPDSIGRTRHGVERARIFHACRYKNSKAASA
jgi:hypothetical protein